MSYLQNPATFGVGGMFEYENAASMVIDQVSTYHPMWTSGVVAGVLDGWTFTAGQSGTFSAVANAGGGQIQITIGAHTLVAGQPFAITSSSAAGYQPPNPTLFLIQSVTATTVNVVAAFTATATGTWTQAAYLKAGTSSAGKYEVTWGVSCKSAGANKLYKFEPVQNTTNLDKAAAGSLLTTTDLQCLAASAFITISAGDVVYVVCQNQTDSTDITIVDMNCRVKRYSAP